MDPISFGIELELGTLLLALVGGIATFVQHRHAVLRRRAMERHHQEMLAMQEKQLREQMSAIRTGEQILKGGVEAKARRAAKPAAENGAPRSRATRATRATSTRAARRPRASSPPAEG